MPHCCKACFDKTLHRHRSDIVCFRSRALALASSPMLLSFHCSRRWVPSHYWVPTHKCNKRLGQPSTASPESCGEALCQYQLGKDNHAAQTALQIEVSHCQTFMICMTTPGRVHAAPSGCVHLASQPLPDIHDLLESVPTTSAGTRCCYTS